MNKDEKLKKAIDDLVKQFANRKTMPQVNFENYKPSDPTTYDSAERSWAKQKREMQEQVNREEVDMMYRRADFLK